MQSKIEIIAENLMTIHPLLFKSLSKPLRAKTSITPGGMFVLASLKRNGILSMSDIGKCLSMPKPHVTVIVDRLVEEEYVERHGDPHDRRIINIVITEKGLKDFEEIKLIISEDLKEKLHSLNGEQQDQLMLSSQNVKDLLISILAND